jgi:uncharacterized protein (DUF302 family)
MHAIETTVPLSMTDTDHAIRETLGAQGFGVLTEIDVAATLKAKLGIERPPLVILGACNPNFAHQALELDPTVALLLPCNVVLEAADGGTHVSVVDPRELMDDPRFKELADEAAGKLQAAVDELSARVS